MIKIVLVVSLILACFFLILPFLNNISSYFLVGLSYITEYSAYIIDFLQDILSSFSQYYYLMMIFYVFLALAIIKLLINRLGE